jgi:hypothetical protein
MEIGDCDPEAGPFPQDEWYLRLREESPVKTKVKVDRVKLTEVVKMRLRKAENEHKRAVKAHPAKVKAWNQAQAKRLEKMLAHANNGGLPASATNFRIESPPAKPGEGKDLCNLRRMLKTLEIGTEDAILLSQEDADWYFGPCRI